MQDDHKRTFEFFNEIGIIQQLAVSMFNRRLPDGLHVSHFSVLNHMTRLGDGKTPLSLANAFQVTKGTMTHTIATLEKRGFVEVAPNASDGRSKLVYLTDAGRKFQAAAIESLMPSLEVLARNMDVNKLQEALPVLRQVRQILDENRDP